MRCHRRYPSHRYRDLARPRGKAAHLHVIREVEETGSASSASGRPPARASGYPLVAFNQTFGHCVPILAMLDS